MGIRTVPAIAIGAFIIANSTACAAQPETQPQAPEVMEPVGEAEGAIAPISTAHAILIDRARNEVGTARFQQGPNGVVITIEAAGIGTDGTGQWHGAHLHRVGDCSNEDFTSSGGHINPDGASHGFLSENGPDNADIPNLWVHGDGSLKAQAFNTRVSISGTDSLPALLDEDGSALVIHANLDDMITQPIGGAGARIICGVITPEE